MKCFSAFVFALASTATASPLEKRQVQPVQRFDVGGFTANCRAGGGCRYVVCNHLRDGIVSSLAMVRGGKNTWADNNASNAENSWTFNVVEFPNAAAITCTGTVLTGTTFPATTPPFPCSDPAVLFQFQSIPALGSYRLVMTDVHVVACSRGGSRLMPAADFPVVTDGTGTHQTYVGATSFSIEGTGACNQM